MRTRYGIHLLVLAMVLCVGYVAQGQNRDKAADSAKKKADPANPTTKDSPKPGDNASKAAEPAKKEAADSSKSDTEADEQAVRAAADMFTKLYNEHDSKSLAKLFTPKAEMIDEDDNVVKGRDAIEAAFQRVFEENPKSSMKVNVESVRILTPSLAIEEGTALSKNSPDDAESTSVYVAIHAKINGTWNLVCVRDWDSPSSELSPHDRLEQNLSWLLGDWIDESTHSNVHTTCTWDETGNFLLQEYRVNVAGAITTSGTTRIGWNAMTKQFQSWVFDSNGGHTIGSWVFDGEKWIVKTQGVTAKGESGSSTNFYRPINDGRFAWGSVDRLLDGANLPDIPEVIVTRQPPQPAE